MKTQKLFFEKKKTIVIHEERLGSPGPGQVLVEAKYSAISTGSEMVLFRGDFPEGMTTDMSLNSLAGVMKYPLSYGYALVGKVIEIGKNTDPEWLDKSVFLFHPHQSYIVVPQTELFLIPPDLNEKNALFLPNMETAIGCVMDAAPLLGENVVIFGQGVVGLLTTSVLVKYPLNRLVAVDPLEKRRITAKNIGANAVFDPGDKHFFDEIHDMFHSKTHLTDQQSGPDLIFEMSGNPEVLNTAISIAGYHSRIIVGSWYGTKTARLNLGDRFHRNRLRIISSQVSTIQPDLRGRWNKERRMEMVWSWLKQVTPSRLITHYIPFSEAQSAYALLDEQPEQALQVVLTYEGRT